MIPRNIWRTFKPEGGSLEERTGSHFLLLVNIHLVSTSGNSSASSLSTFSSSLVWLMTSSFPSTVSSLISVILSVSPLKALLISCHQEGGGMYVERGPDVCVESLHFFHVMTEHEHLCMNFVLKLTRTDKTPLTD